MVKKLIYFDFNNIFDNCSRRINNVAHYIRYLKCSTCEEFDNTIVLQSKSGTIQVIVYPSLPEETIKAIESDILDWAIRQAYNDIISSFIIYIDEIIHLETVLTELKDPGFSVLNREKKYKNEEEYIKKTFNVIRSRTLLRDKLDTLFKKGYFYQEDIDNVVNLYNSRNAIEHWDSHTNPVSFRSNEEIFSVWLPTFEIVEYDYSSGKEKILNNKLDYENFNRDEIKIVAEFYEQQLHEGDQITISYNDLMFFVQWIVHIIHEMKDNISQKRPSLTKEEMEIIEELKKHSSNLKNQ